MLLVLVVAGAYGTLYTSDRFKKMQHNVACDRLGKSAPNSEYAQTLPSCAYEIVPPTLWEKLTGHRLGERPAYPISEGCDQSATTTDCSKFALTRPPAIAMSPNENAIATSTLSNFSFEYPARVYVSGFGSEGVAFRGNLNISIPTNRETVNVFIFTTPAPMGSINPSAKTLDDYKTDYPLSATGTQQVLVNGASKNIETREIVRILSSKNVFVNDIPMVRQRYSVGHWTLDNNGNRVFGDTDESEVHDELRYVFFDGKIFVTLTGWHSDIYIDQIAYSVRLLK